MPKTFATCLGDDPQSLERLMLGSCSLSSAGFALNSGSAQTATVTVAAKQTDDVCTVTVNGTDYDYTVLVGDADNAAVATALAALIDASDDVAAAAEGAVITVTASDATKAFTISSSVAGTDPTTTLAVAITHVSVQKIATANTLQYCVGGVGYSKAATADIAVGGDPLLASSSRWYLVSIDAAGDFTVTPGTDKLPPIPAGTAPCGAFKVETAANTVFTPGTTALNATGVTTIFYNLGVVPKAGVPG